MPLPVAHGLLGASVFIASRPKFSLTRDWRLLLTCAFLGVSPDFDYGLNWLRVSGGGWHHGFTHSVMFAFLVGAIAPLVAGTYTAREVLTFSAVVLSHAVLDFLFTESRGVALLWPFSDHRFKLLLPNPIDYSWKSAPPSEAVFGLLKISLIEAAVFAPVLIAVMSARRNFVKRRATD